MTSQLTEFEFLFLRKSEIKRNVFVIWADGSVWIIVKYILV